jgi:hypothetical protein
MSKNFLVIPTEASVLPVFSVSAPSKEEAEEVVTREYPGEHLLVPIEEMLKTTVRDVRFPDEMVDK